MSAALVEVESVTKRFAGITAVDGLSLTIAGGRFVTLLGPSGCGKTTLLRMIGGLETADSGRIRVAGRDIASYRGPERPTRMVFQSYALFPHMTVARNIAYGLTLKGLGRRELDRLVAAELETVGLPDKALFYPGQLSGGQQQRVALARALVTKPKLLLLDEPLAALDLKLRQRMQAELKTLQRAAGITFLFVTHDQHEALALSDEIMVMRKGRVAQRGTPSAIYERPTSRYVATFVGDATVVTGHVEPGAGTRRRVSTPFGPLLIDLPPGASVAGAWLAGGTLEGRVDLVIRPEHVRLGDGPENVVRGRIASITYRGSDAMAELAVGTETLRLLVPPSRIAALAVGSEVAATIPSETIWAMSPDSDG